MRVWRDHTIFSGNGRRFEVTSNVGDGERIDKERPRQDSKDVKLVYPSFGGPGQGGIVNSVERRCEKLNRRCISSFIRSVRRDETAEELVQVVTKKIHNLISNFEEGVKDAIGRATVGPTVAKGKTVTSAGLEAKALSPLKDSAE